ncbi:MAG: diguanylate cyclase [Betaproteobacteria bacterium]|nr:diguanylate cyclase [Betaproteobacteria bacterium]
MRTGSVALGIISAARLVLSLFISSAVVSAHALDPAKPLTQFRLTQWGVDDGLTHGSVHMITEDPDGFLWIGALTGLTRFDGVSFRPAIPANAERIDYFARSVAFGPDGTWAVMSEGGVARRIDQRWQLLPLTDVGFVRAIAVRRAGGYWLGSERGLFIMTVTDGVPSAKPAGYGPRGPIWHLRDDGDGQLWISAESGFHLADAEGKVRHLDREFGLPPRTAWIVQRDRGGVHWLGGRNGLIRFDGAQHRRYGVEQGLAQATVRWITEDATGSLWLATPGAGVQRFHPAESRFETFNTANGLASDSVMSLHSDRAGNLWIGMAGGGIARLSEVPLVVLRKRDGLTGDWIWAVQEDAKGDIWVATNGNGVTVLRGDRAIRRVPDIDTVWALHTWDDGRAIVSTTAGVARLERDNRLTWLARAQESEPLPRVFLRLTDDRLLIAKGKRFLHVTESGLTPTRFPELPANISSVMERADGTLVVGTRAGGLMAVREGGTLTELAPPAKAPVLSVRQDGAGRLWAAAGGLLIVDGDRHAHVGGRHGFPDRAANELILTGEDQLWLGTNRGIVRASRRELLTCLDNPNCRPHVEVMDERDGLSTAETNGGAQPAGWLDRAGRVWLPAINGLIRIDPNAEPRRAGLPAVAIDALRADRKLLLPGTVVPALTRDIEIDYTLPELTLPKRVEFRYRLLPDAPDWVDARTRRTAFFAGLKPGSHTFEVSASLPAGQPTRTDAPNAPVTRLEFVVAAAWYQTWWARFGAGAILFAVLLLAPWLRFQALRSRKRALEAEVDQRTAELARANADLDRLARTDALTGIANRREFAQRLAKSCAAFSGDGVLAVYIADIDHFKAYNDHHGHLIGDECLAAVAGVIDRAMREAGGLACRYGGEEFAATVRLPDVGRAEALAAALVRAVAEMGRPHARSTTAAHVTLSVGMKYTAQSTPDAAALLQAADEALYEAKRAGRDTWRRAG